MQTVVLQMTVIWEDTLFLHTHFVILFEEELEKGLRFLVNNNYILIQIVRKM